MQIGILPMSTKRIEKPGCICVCLIRSELDVAAWMRGCREHEEEVMRLGSCKAGSQGYKRRVRLLKDVRTFIFQQSQT